MTFRIFSFVTLAVFCLHSCRPEAPGSSGFDPAAYLLPDNFRIECIAAEPLIEAPVAITFDTRGRIWVAEMRGYMTDLENSGEQQASGRISILEDRNEDGVMDQRTTFLDSLVLPRALALVYGGLLYAEPPNLWFVPINGDQPGHRLLVDSLYAPGGNVEHQPNGLLVGLDNWIYSAKSDVRYRRKNGRWLREKTHFRGQWGITADDRGRLLYNDNSNQLQGDLLLPNALLRNRFFTPSAGFNIQVCADQRVYPALPTAVNRGYEPGVLDSTGRLRQVTSACGPLVYRGGQFPPEFAGNAFICVPEANAVKRDTFAAGQPLFLQAHQAYAGREFLSSTDPGFRPVNLYTGPDGSMYIVDMHRGIIQHKTYMTAYLRDQILARGLDSITGQGRILRVVCTSRTPPAPVRLEDMGGVELAGLLSHSNGWVRDQARRLLIERSDPAAVPLLQKTALDPARPEQQIQALWTLEGLDALQPELLAEILTTTNDAWVVLTTLHLLEQFAEQAGAVLPVLEMLHTRADPVVDLALCLYAGAWGQHRASSVYPLLAGVVRRHSTDTLYHEALVSGLSEQEAIFLDFLQKNSRPTEALYLKKILRQASNDRLNKRLATWAQEPVVRRDKLTSGLTLYNQYCSPCHGPTGLGTPHLAPPLYGSEFVHGPADRLVRIALYGLQGPVRVNGVSYTFNTPMPGLHANAECTDADLAAILTYVRNAFSREPAEITAGMIQAQRGNLPANGVSFTVEEILGPMKK